MNKKIYSFPYGDNQINIFTFGSIKKYNTNFVCIFFLFNIFYRRHCCRCSPPSPHFEGPICLADLTMSVLRAVLRFIYWCFGVVWRQATCVWNLAVSITRVWLWASVSSSPARATIEGNSCIDLMRLWWDKLHLHVKHSGKFLTFSNHYTSTDYYYCWWIVIYFLLEMDTYILIKFTENSFK